MAQAGVALLLVLTAGGCANGQTNVTLPTSSPTVTARPSPISAEEAVRQSYTRYWAVLPEAEHADSESRRRQLLSGYATEPQLSTALRGINDLHAKDLTSAGYVMVHITKVHVEDARATVWDCQDATKALVQQRSTGRTVSRGVPNDQLRATLTRGSDGQWRIERFSPLKRC